MVVHSVADVVFGHANETASQKVVRLVQRNVLRVVCENVETVQSDFVVVGCVFAVSGNIVQSAG